VNGHPGHVISSYLDLSCVQPYPHRDPQGVHSISDGTGTLDRTSGSVEGGQEAISRVVDLAAPEAFGLAPDQLVVAVEQVPPAPISKLGSTLCRPDNVGEKHGGQNPIRVWGMTGAGQEFLDLSHRGVTVTDEDQIVLTR
jgi:hypothetical protein